MNSKEVFQVRRFGPLAMPFGMMLGIALIFVAAGIQLLGKGGSFLLFLAAATIAALLWMYKRITRGPMLWTDGDNLIARPLFGGEKNFIVKNSKLVISNTYVAFRDANGEGEVLLDRGFFQRQEWDSVITQLKKLPFTEIIAD